MVNIAPPPLPVYAQPMLPGDGYIWTPGYWAWNGSADDYYWVPGTWVLAPADGQLWTPGYWAFRGDGYFWNAGYWGSSVGYYGGVNYGYGYTGNGYQGGRWEGSHFRYNAAVSHVDKTIVQNTYNTRAVNSSATAHASYSVAPPSGASRPARNVHEAPAADRGTPTAEQLQHEHTALVTPTQRAWVPHGPPQVAATVKPLAFNAAGVEHVRVAPTQRAAPAPRAQAPRAEAPHPQVQRQQERPAAHAEQPQGHGPAQTKPER